MALDGIMLSFIAAELRGLVDGKIEKIAQPSKEQIIISIRNNGETKDLLLSAGSGNARIHLTKEKAENPKTPPMFCQLLRKHLGGGRLREIKQLGLDRVIHLGFEAMNELGDIVTITIAAELMGRHSNVILFDGNQKIIDAIKRVAPDMSSVRPVLPGMSYSLPPGQSKYNITAAEPSKIAAAVTSESAELSKAILSRLEGISPIAAREMAQFVTRGAEKNAAELDTAQTERLEFILSQLKEMIAGGQCRPTAVFQKDMTPKDICFLNVTQYGGEMITKGYPTISEMLDSYYFDRDSADRMRQRSNDLFKIVMSTLERVSRRLQSQKEELLQSAAREAYKIKGDLLSANIYRIEKGADSIEVENFYDNNEPLKIELDSKLTPSENIQRYYADYRKLATAEKMLTGLIEAGEKELEYLDSVFDALTRARSDAEISAIREELEGQGYARKRVQKGMKPQKLPPLKYISSDGFEIFCGRSNIQNDQLTLKTAEKSDLWFHAQKISGSHVIVAANGARVPDKTVEEAAKIAAHNSKGRGGAKISVDYTEVRYVKKPQGAKPGMVIYDRYKTAVVSPGEQEIAALLAKK